MLSFPPSVRIYLAAGVTDMRKSFDGLSGVTRNVLSLDPLSGHLFVFCNRRKNRLKILYWDGSGFWCLAKRLERGTFAWPVSSPPERRETCTRDLMLILEGIDARDVTFRKRMDRRPA